MSFILKWLRDLFRADPRSGSYGRIVAWVESKYGPINPDDPLSDVQIKFESALSSARSEKGEKAVRGLSKYVFEQRYKDLLNEESEY